jgi:hypothetical protein
MRNLLTQNAWEETTATITACQCRPIITMLGRRRLLVSNRFSYFYEVSFVYAAGGKTFTAAFTAYQPYTEGQTFRILYDPADPQRNSKNDPQGDNTTALVITAACIAGALLLLLLKSNSRF